MSQRTRTRGLALWLMLGLVLLLPLASSAAEDEYTDEEAEEAAPAAAEDEADEAAAEEEDDADAVDWEVTHRGFYLIGTGSYNFMTNKSDLEDKARDAGDIGPSNDHVEDSWGYGGRIGWRFLDRLALEGQVQVLNSIEIHNHEQASGDNKRSKATFFNAMGNAKAYLLTERIQPYGLVGAGYGYAELDPPGGNRDDRDEGFAAQFGVGADFYATDNIGLVTEVAYVLPTGDIEDYDYVALHFGVMLRFYGE